MELLCDCFSAVGEKISAGFLISSKTRNFPKIVQVNRKCVNSFDVDCTHIHTYVCTYIYT